MLGWGRASRTCILVPSLRFHQLAGVGSRSLSPSALRAQPRVGGGCVCLM